MQKLIESAEFKLCDIVTLDRYNHVDQPTPSTVIGYTTSMSGDQLLYQLDVHGQRCTSSGKCIKESTLYDPVDEKERHPYDRRFQDKLDEEAINTEIVTPQSVMFAKHKLTTTK